MRSAEEAGASAEASVRENTASNRPAKVSGFFALASVAFLGNFATGIAWLNPAIFVGLAAVCALLAIPVGHVGRLRGRRLGGSGRGVALAGIVTGWLVLLVCALAVLAFAGIVAGLAVVTDRA
ncbi:hypothetical protein AB0L50_22575 [Streptomyces flaveolus]|uniref:hypothetical protein n=1 Tax=Streptomyces flaveolus TaxID=67297 RepID=UPI0034413BA8